MKYIANRKMKIGMIHIEEEEGYITRISFSPFLSENAIEEDTPLLQKTFLELAEYFTGKRKEFDIPLNPKGTNFMKMVWKELQNIPYGQTRSYQEIAMAIQNEKACRAVGMANNRNPIGIIIPCHRVIGKTGKLIGYAGGVYKKEMLLELEKKYQ